MEGKYYTPSIEDFHVGFEYEMKYYEEEENWVNFKWSGEVSLLSIMNAHYEWGVLDGITVPDCIRVKYLDQEDIEELGWVFMTQGNVNNYTFERHDDSFMRMTFSYGEPPSVDFYRYCSWETPRFKVKNKFELKKLMEQLDII